jgi:copper transport protein
MEFLMAGWNAPTVKRKKPFAVASLIAMFVLSCVWFVPVQAHSLLARSIPPANASLKVSPPQVDLYFSEAVAQRLSQVKVINGSGVQIDNKDMRVDPQDPTHLVVSLPALFDGVYLVVWQVISATDGHQTSGSFPFGVGNVPLASMTAFTDAFAATKAPLPLAGMVVKGILYLAASTLLGAIIFTSLAWNPSLRKAAIPVEVVQAYESFSRKLILVGILTLAIANLLSLMVLAGLAKAALIGWPWQPEFGAVMASTRMGTLGILRFEAAGVLAILLLPRKNFWNRWGGLLVCLLLLLTFSLESHAAGNARPFVPVLVDWIHLTTVSVWIGGLFSFLGGMFIIRRLAPEPRTLLTSILIPHYTVLALTSVGVLALTGLYSAFLDVGRLNALSTTLYGQVLVVKLLIAVPLLTLGAINLLFTTPVMRRAAARPGGNTALVTGFSYMLAMEAILGVSILLWVGAFTTLQPSSLDTVPTGFNQAAPTVAFEPTFIPSTDSTFPFLSY